MPRVQPLVVAMTLGHIKGKKGSRNAGCASCLIRPVAVLRNGYGLCKKCAKTKLERARG